MKYYIIDGKLYHSEGKERKKHKYIARIPLKSKNGKKRFRYFYKLADWLSFKNKKKNTKENTRKSSVEKGKAFVDKYKDKSVKSFLAIIPASKYKKAVDALIDGVKNVFTNTFEKLNPNKKEHKYVEKVKLPNGKYRYFYSEDEYEDYLERLEYQKNEPDFMKNIPDIPSDKVYEKMEDMEKVNEEYNPYDDSRSMNCGNCSAAYELRRRGYDVEAEAVDEDYNGKWSRAYEYFEGAEIIGIYGDGETLTIDEDFLTKACGEGVDEKDTARHKEDYDFLNTNHNYTAESLEKAILDNNPPGSRGFIDVSWKAGGAHSIVYEVDKKGKVTIRDSQVYDEYDLDELASYINGATITRTDNLKLKEGILNTVDSNKDGEREYYVDKRRVNYYD